MAAADWLKPFAVSWQVVPFLGHVEVVVEETPEVIVAQFIRSVTQGECVPAGCTASVACATTPVACSARICAVAAACKPECQCAEGKICACTNGPCTCKDCPCKKSCADCPCAVKTCACGPNCPCKKTSCACGPNCPCAANECCGDCSAAPRGVWLTHPAPAGFGVHWTPVVAHPFVEVPYVIVPSGVFPPVFLPESPRPIAYGRPEHRHPLAAWHMHPPYPRILPPVVEEKWEERCCEQLPQAGFYPTSRTLRKPTPTARPAGTAPVHAGHRVHYSNSSFEAACDQLSYHENGVVVLEGNVQIVLRSQPSGKITAQRVEVNSTGGFHITTAPRQPQPFAQPDSGVVPSSYKPDTSPVPAPRPLYRSH